VIPPVDRIRAAFPALERTHHGHSVAFFDGPGGTQVPQAVTGAMVEYLHRHNANTHWAYPTSEETDRLIAEARGAVADFVNGRADEIVFGANMTTLAFHLARGLGREWGPGDEVVITDLDHHANRAPWEDLVRERGITVQSLPFDPRTGELDPGQVARALTSRTRLVAIGAASNALGTITDVAPVCSLARARGVLSFVDAVHYAPHELVDVQAMGCDFLGISPYKFYGPHAGVLWGREDLLRRVPVSRLAPAPDTPPERLETGTQSHEAICGTRAAIDFLAGLATGRPSRRSALAAAMTGLHRAGFHLFRQMWDGLGALPDVTLYGPPPDRPRTPTLAFTVRGWTAEAVTRHLAALGVFVSHGDFYAATVVETLGVEGLVRAGCACYSTTEEVERLIAGVASCSQGRATSESRK
jgi:cysteine desulfurase family protein (TIGR01976 family)